MSVKNAVSGQVDRAKEFVERLRSRYLSAYTAAVEGSSERLSDLARLSESLNPGLRDKITEQIDSLQRRLDELNRSLADKAVPSHRKAKVGEMSLKEKARQATEAGRKPALQAVSTSPSAEPVAKRVARKAPLKNKATAVVELSVDEVAPKKPRSSRKKPVPKT